MVICRISLTNVGLFQNWGWGDRNQFVGKEPYVTVKLARLATISENT